MKDVLSVRFEASLKDALNRQITLRENIEDLRSSYLNAKPFPYILIDGMFESTTLEQLVKEIPSRKDGSWLRHSDDRQELLASRSAIELGEAGSRLVAILHSASFLYFLSAITGIRELLPDPYLQGGGYHVMPPGAFFDVHVDRNVAYETGLLRRIGLIVYLNVNWQHEFGGQLQLWSADGKTCEVVVEPVFNRTIIFEIGDRNYHGVPTPISCPAHDSRKAFLTYYHTSIGKKDESILPHTSLFLPTIYRKNAWTRGILQDVIPPLIYRNLARIRNRIRNHG